MTDYEKIIAIATVIYTCCAAYHCIIDVWKRIKRALKNKKRLAAGDHSKG